MVDVMLLVGGASLLTAGGLRAMSEAAGVGLDEINRRAREVASFVEQAFGEPDTSAPDPDADLLGQIDASEKGPCSCPPGQ